MHVVATAGHVDHGKSALLRRLTGMEPDRWAEERRRGLTIDLGYVWTELPVGRRDRGDGDGGDDAISVAFVDVPGHDSFLPNMLCGVGVVERVLFVVAADDGWSAQSEEHLEILDLLERDAVAAVVTKADLAGPDRTGEVMAQVRSRLATTSLREAPVIAVDSLSGTGFDRLRTTLTERLGDPTNATVRPGNDPGAGAGAVRVWIDRAFTVKGAGTVVTGMLASGSLELGQDVEVAPRGAVGRVRGLQILGRDTDTVATGSRVAINLGGVGLDEVGRGDVLRARRSAGSGDRHPSTAVDVRLRALPHATIGRSGAWHLHVGTAATTVRILPLLGDLEPGTSAPVRLELTDPLSLRAGDRFVIREAGRRRTTGGGWILDPHPGPRRRGTEARLGHALVLEELSEATEPSARLRGLVDAHDGLRGLAELRSVLGGPVPIGTAGPGAPGDRSDLVVLADTVVRTHRLDRWNAHVLATARDAPPDRAVESSRLAAAATDAGAPDRLGAAIVEQLAADGRLRRHGGRFVHPDHERAYLEARAVRRGAFVTALVAAPLDPPEPAALAARVGIPAHEVQELLDAGEVVACGALMFPPTALTEAVELLADGPGRDGAPFTASQARQAWGTNRRSAMPLLDHLRATGATRFDGAHHRLTPPGTDTTDAGRA